jgi:pimeloyl-ACP methyl ester carboxylesterase
VSPFAVRTADEVDIRGVRLGSGSPAVVLLHGFLGWHAKPRFGALAERLSSWFTVYAPDLRGHGASGGRCAYGAAEVEDVEAVVRLARDQGGSTVVTVGTSMGGTAALRHAALFGGVDGVVAISAPARWVGHGTKAEDRMVWMMANPRGRAVARAMGVRMADRWDDPEPTEALVGKIAPIPVTFVHGVDDHFFGEEDAWRLYRAAGEPKRLLLASRFGHGTDGFTPAFAERLARQVCSMTGAAAWSG